MNLCRLWPLDLSLARLTRSRRPLRDRRDGTKRLGGGCRIVRCASPGCARRRRGGHGGAWVQWCLWMMLFATAVFRPERGSERGQGGGWMPQPRRRDASPGSASGQQHACSLQCCHPAKPCKPPGGSAERAVDARCFAVGLVGGHNPHPHLAVHMHHLSSSSTYHYTLLLPPSRQSIYIAHPPFLHRHRILPAS